MSERSLKPTEQRILTSMIENAGHHSTREIAELSGVSWNTAQKYLKEFLKPKWIDHYKSGNRDYWKATPPKGAGK